MDEFALSYHLSSKDHSKGHAPIVADPNLWPKEWKTVKYKEYPRLKKIKLKLEKGSLYSIIEKRKSTRSDISNSILTKSISNILISSVGTISENSNHRPHPSAGGLYPIETYLILVNPKDENLKKGLYHFSPKTHEISVLWDRKFSEEDIVGLFGYPWTKNASAFIVLTATFNRQKKKYGERAYRCTLLEAGHIGQNIYLSCADEGVGCCSLSSANDRKLEKLIGIDGVTESVVYAIAIF